MSKLSESEQSVLIFAARYAHKRKTAAAMVVCNEIVRQWDKLGWKTQTQIINEIMTELHGGTLANLDDWDRVLKRLIK